MIPTDLSAFSTEQLKGFATANSETILSLRADLKETPENPADRLSTLEVALDNQDRLNAAIAEALAAEEAEEKVDEAVAGDGDGEEATADGDGDADAGEGDDADAGDGEGGDAEATVDEAVASAQMGGGSGPRVGKEPLRSMEAGDVTSFLRSATSGRLTPGSRQQFASLKRSTNFEISHKGDLTAMLPEIVAARQNGTDKTAAGCFCGPDDARNEIARALVSDRPFSDSLPTVTGGDFRFIRQIDLAAARTGVTIWDCDDQDDVDPASAATWKPCFALDCQNEVTSETYAVPACASFDTQAMIGNPNLIDNLEHVMTVAYNEAAELEAYRRVLAEASQVTYNASALPVGYGASAKLIKAVAWAMSTIRATHRDRLDYTLALPAGLRERILADGMIRATDDYRTWDDVQTRLAELGVTDIVELLDPTSAPNALPAPGGPPVEATQQPLEQQILLYRPENFLLGVGPEIDLGVVAQGIDELRQNRMNWFVESFESVTRIGVQPTVAINADFCDNGIRPAFGEGDICAVEVG